LLQFSFAVSQWLLPKYPHQVPPPTLPFYLQCTYCLPSTTTSCHTDTASAPISACHEALVKTLPIHFGPFSSGPILHCNVFFSLLNLYSLNRHLPLLGPQTHRPQACLSLCPSNSRVLSLSITLDIRLFLLILQLLSSKLLFPRLPRGNLGEPNTKHTVRTLRN